MGTENQDNLPRENEVHVESTPRQRLGDIARTVGKYTGLAALTAISPPIGLGVWTRDIKGVIAGMILNVVASIGLGGLIQGKIYDSPNIYEGRSFEDTLSSTLKGVTGIPLSFPLVYSATFPATRLDDLDSSRVVYGKDVIEFDQSTGYSLNFEPDRRFMSTFASEGRLVSLVEAQNKIDELKEKQRGFVSRGDVLGARKINRKLEDAKAYHEKVSSEYNSMRTLYEGAVGKMNAELGELSRGGETQK